MRDQILVVAPPRPLGAFPVDFPYPERDLLAEARQEKAVLALTVALRDGQILCLREDLEAQIATAEALFARVRDLEKGRAAMVAAPDPMRESPDLLSWWGTLTLAWDRLVAHLKWAAA